MQKQHISPNPKKKITANGSTNLTNFAQNAWIVMIVLAVGVLVVGCSDIPYFLLPVVTLHNFFSLRPKDQEGRNAGEQLKSELNMKSKIEYEEQKKTETK